MVMINLDLKCIDEWCLDLLHLLNKRNNQNSKTYFCTNTLYEVMLDIIAKYDM